MDHVGRRMETCFAIPTVKCTQAHVAVRTDGYVDAETDQHERTDWDNSAVILQLIAEQAASRVAQIPRPRVPKPLRLRLQPALPHEPMVGVEETSAEPHAIPRASMVDAAGTRSRSMLLHEVTNVRQRPRILWENR
jgi:hypothetical protein